MAGIPVSGDQDRLYVLIVEEANNLQNLATNDKAISNIAAFQSKVGAKLIGTFFL